MTRADRAGFTHCKAATLRNRHRLPPSLGCPQQQGRCGGWVHLRCWGRLKGKTTKGHDGTQLVVKGLKPKGLDGSLEEASWRRGV